MRRLLVPLLFGFAGIAVLVSLGVWQMQRLAWKDGVLAQINAQLSRVPVPLPAHPDPVADKYLAVTVAGRFDTGLSNGGALRVLSGAKDIGAGYLLISPFILEDGRRVLIDRGLIKADADIPAPLAEEVEITGNVLWPDDRTDSTPDNDQDNNIWFARDVEEMALSLKTEPFLVVTRLQTPADPNVTPVPVDTSHIPNNHLNYAITWFSLAFIWLVMTIYFIRKQGGPKRGDAT